MKKVVISGSTGTIGTTLTNLLTSRGIRCVLLNVPEFVHPEEYANHELIDFVDCPLDGYKDYAQREDCPRDCDAFIHLAWAGSFGPRRDDVSLQLANIQGTIDAVELAKAMGCKSFVGAGSQAEYGKGVESNPHAIAPVTGYGMAKLASGEFGRLKASQLGIRFNWIRIFSVFGPNMGAGTLTQYVVSTLLNGESPKLTKCEQIWDFLYAKDAVEAIIRVAEFGKDGKTYELGSGVTGTIRSFLETVPALLHVELPLEFGAIDYPPNQIMRMCADVAPLKEDTGWEPKHTFADGILAIAEACRRQK